MDIRRDGNTVVPDHRANIFRDEEGYHSTCRTSYLPRSRYCMASRVRGEASIFELRDKERVSELSQTGLRSAQST